MDFDAIIVGAGAGGGVAAYVLAARGGLKVALLEKGRNPVPGLGKSPLRGSQFGDDEVKLRRNFGFHDPFIEPRTFRATAADTATVRPVQELGVSVGGGTNFYDGNSPRLQRWDLARKSLLGPVPGADVEDWPLDYQALAPFYDAAEALIGVQGLAGSDVFAEARNPYPMPPGAPTKACLLLADGARALGYHPHPMPIAINSVAYRGRPACTNAGFCNVGCPTNAKSSTAVTAIHEAVASGNLTLIENACALEVLTEPSGTHASGVRYLDARGEEQTLSARHVVLALNAIETPRLLLTSASSQHPDGLGNSSGLVGRYLMFHIVMDAIGIFDREVRSYRGRVSTHGLSDFTVPTSGVPRGGYVEMGGQLRPVAEGADYPWLLHRDLMLSGRYRTHIAAVAMMGEDMPVFDNRVDLDPSVRDVYGRPAARITWSRLPYDQQMVDLYHPKLEAIARAAGATDVMLVDDFKRTGSPQTKHLMGSTRMGRDPAKSVCDEWGRLHDLDNVWVADGGLWPTSTAFNPTLTQQAMAWRTAAHLAGSDVP